jgi:hypothetical protein
MNNSTTEYTNGTTIAQSGPADNKLHKSSRLSETAQQIAQPPASKETDLFASLASLRVDPSLTDGPVISKALVSLPVRKPSKEWFVQAHPDPAHFGLDALILELKEESDLYFVPPAMREALLGESTVHVKRLRLAVTRQGDYFVWPARLPGADGKLDTWNQSALDAMELATSKWVRLSANRRLGAYDIAVAAIDDVPDWPEMPYNELLRIAFKGKIIDSVDHPVLRRLRGEI